ncbi:MAG: hypothetical protein AB7I27_12050 [Bacteriovoracaceae bacterium]
MKTYFILLIFIFSNVQAKDDFGGINFHSSINQENKKALVLDLKYLFTHKESKKNNELKQLLKNPSTSGENLHHWLVNRIQYILPPQTQDHHESKNSSLMMSNLSSALYLKNEPFEFEGMQIEVTSPRVGIIQIGESLFKKEELINSNIFSEANSIQRLGVLFHEARHSDGHSENLGFPHYPCPSGHVYEGYKSCDISSNGANTIEAQIMKYYLQSCAQCSSEDKTVIEALIADAHSRMMTQQDLNISQIQTSINYYSKITLNYQELLQNTDDQKLKDRYSQEIEKIKTKMKELEYEKELLDHSDKNYIPLDETPEGSWKELSLKETIKIMKRSLYGK